MKTNIIVAAISAVVSILVWEGMHVISGVDLVPESQQTNKTFIWRNRV
jgi:hypothetical protein